MASSIKKFLEKAPKKLTDLEYLKKQFKETLLLGGGVLDEYTFPARGYRRPAPA